LSGGNPFLAHNYLKEKTIVIQEEITNEDIDRRTK
jgi:hypothetical protein